MAMPLPVKREYPRYDTNVSAMVICPNMRIGVRMLSVSAGGAMVRLDRMSAKVFEDDSFLIEISGIGRFSVTKKWRRDTDIGAGFVLSDSDRARLAERLAERFDPNRPKLRRFTANSPQP